jgi:uroporphyrinogen-III synthase
MDRGAPIGAIPARGAEVDTVLPCVYDAGGGHQYVTAIEEMAKGRTDAIALTSSDQVRVKPIDARRSCASGWTAS